MIWVWPFGRRPMATAKRLARKKSVSCDYPDVFGVTFAFLFLGERLTPIQWVGAAVILVSVFELVWLTGANRPKT